MNRKEFLATTFVAGLGLSIPSLLLSCVSLPAARSLYEPLSLSAGNIARVRGNVSRYTNKGGTVGILETADSFVVIDSQFEDSIKPVIDAIQKTEKKVAYLFNTHHHGDHVSGNILFKSPQTKLVAHRSVPALQRQAALASNTLNKQWVADILFDKTYTAETGGEKITAYHFGAGHTSGDAVYHFENDNVVHMGDLMFVNMIPVYRTKDGSNSPGWINVLSQVLDKFNDDTLFIFGHSDTPQNSVGTKVQIREMLSFLAATNNWISAAIKKGISTETLLQKNTFVPGFENRLTPSRFPDFVKGVRETLEKS